MTSATVTESTSLELRGLTRVFAGGVRAVDAVSFTVRPGEFVSLVGPSGSGKSTLLRLVAGLDQPTAGSVWIGDRDQTRTAPRDRGLALVFQTPALYPHLSTEANLAFGLRARGTSRLEWSERVREVAGWLGLSGLLQRRPAALSGGERQRVALGRAIATRPRLLLLDEPFSSLDAPLRAELRGLLADLHQRLGTTILHVTHDQAEALALSDRIGILRAGRLEQVGTPREVYANPANAFVARFIGSPGMTLLPVSISKVDDGVLLQCEGIEPIKALQASWPEGTFQLGLRCDAVVLDHKTAATHADLLWLPGRHPVARVEFQGRQTLVTVRVGPHELVALTDEPPDARVLVGLRLDAARLFTADGTTAIALAGGDAVHSH